MMMRDKFNLSYTEGALTFGVYDSGQNGPFGDEAELVVSAGYTEATLLWPLKVPTKTKWKLA